MRRSVRIELRLTEPEDAELRRRAAQEQRSVSGYLRARALQGFTPQQEISNDQ